MIEQKNNDGKLVLEFTNGDIAKFNEVMNKYNFKDAQAFIRFATSILLVAQDKEIKIKKGNDFVSIAPVEDLLKGVEHNGNK